MESVQDPTKLTYSENAYLSDCEDRRETSCTSFTRDNGGFTAVSEGDRSGWYFSAFPMKAAGAHR